MYEDLEFQNELDQEDEECLPESSSLNLYLQDLGLLDVEVFKNKSTHAGNKFSVANSKGFLGVIDKDIIEQIKMFTSTKLIFGEDISVLETLLSRFTVENNGNLKIMFPVVFFFCWCLYFVIGYFAFALVPAFYACKHAAHSFRRNIDKIQLKKMKTLLLFSSSLLDKSVSYIERHKNDFLQDQIETNFALFRKNCYYKFRRSFLSGTNKMINILISSTQSLIKNIPLFEYADTPECYLCADFKNISKDLDDPSKMYLLYLLVQSEFLRRVILSLIPNFHKTLNEDNFTRLSKILNETCCNLKLIKKKLEEDFHFVFYKYSECIDFRPPKPVLRDQYAKELFSNIDDISNISGSVLLKCKNLEDKFTSGKIPSCLEDNLVMLQNAINECQKNITNSFIILKKVNAPKPKPVFMIGKYNTQENLKDNKSDDIEAENITQGVVEYQRDGSDNSNKIKIDYTDLDEVFEDDIFEVYISSENRSREFNEDEWDLDVFLKRKLKQDFSQNVMEELKVRLMERAKNWKEREINVLKKKGLFVGNEESLKDEIKQTEDEIGKKSQKNVCFEKPNSYKAMTFEVNETQRQLISGAVDNSSKNAEENNPNLDDVMESQPCFLLPNKEFLKNLGEARNLIMKSANPEEEFCLSNSDEDEHDNNNENTE